MILVDANLLLYAANHAAPEHEAASTWLDARLSATARVALPWPSLLAFVRIATNPIVMSRPASMAAAWRQVEEWLAAEPVWIPNPTDQHADVMDRFCTTPWMIIMTIGFVVRRGWYDPSDLQVFNRGQTGGRYWFDAGMNWRGMVAWVPAAILGLLFANYPPLIEGPFRNEGARVFEDRRHGKRK